MRHTTRRLLKCLAVPLIVALVGCAARGVQQVSLTTTPSSVSAEDRKACAAFATREAKGARVKSVAEESARGFAYGLLYGIFMFYGTGVVLAPTMAIVGGVDTAVANHSARKVAYRAAEGTCLMPQTLAASFGPEHPAVAMALRNLATRYASQKDYVSAESLYQRALGIQERALGPASDDVSATLDAYAELLRATHREEQATDLSTRAQTIRDNAERGSVPEATAGNDAPAATGERPSASASTPLPADEGE